MHVFTREGSESSIVVRLLVHNRLLREALVRLLQKRAGFCVEDSERYSELGPASTASGSYDVLLADSLSSVRSSVHREELVPERCKGKLLFFGMDDDAGAFLDAVRLGAAGYVLNDASSEDILEAIRSVARGNAVCPPKLCMHLFQHVYSEQERPVLTDEHAGLARDLTLRQRQLMGLVAMGMTNKEIAARLSLSEFTVKNHIRRVMKQVDAESRHQAVDVMRAGGVLPLV